MIRYWQERNRHGCERVSTVFVDNLPIFYDNMLLRRLFSNLGKIHDCYSPLKKRMVTQTKYGFVTFQRENDALFAIKRLNGIVIFNNKLCVMPSKEGKRRGYEKTKGHISVPKPSGNYTKTYAEVVGKRGEAWKEKMANDNGIPKKKEVKTAETTEEQGRCVSMEELEQQIVVMRDMQQEQENKLEDLVLMCLALKNELNLRLGQGSDRKERQYDEGGFDNGGKIVEEDRNSKVLETPIEEEEKSLNGEEEKVEASPEGDGPIAVEQVGDEGVGKFCKAAGALEDSVHSEEGGCGEGNFDMEVEVEEVEEEEEDIDFVAEEMGFDKINGASGNDGIRLVSGNNSKHRSLHYALNTKPTSLRFNHLGSSSGLVLLSKRKKKQASVLGLEDRVEQLSSSRTDSIEPEIGKEFTSKHYREHVSREREEAEATLEVGRLVG